MAGMFYTIQETAEKLGMTEQQVQQLMNDGKLRKIQDGENIYFKIAEVEALMSEVQAAAPIEETPPTPPELEQATPPETIEEPELAATPEESAPPEPQQDDTDIALFEDTATGAQDEPVLDEFSLGSGSGSEISLGDDVDAGDTAIGEESVNILGDAGDNVGATDDDIADILGDTGDEIKAAADDVQDTPDDSINILADTGDDIKSEPDDSFNFLADTGSDVMAAGDDLMAADDDGSNFLGETGSDVMASDDPLSAASDTGEASLSEIEDDVNLDTFGSGSGLLDLSLQADDTSLGGILDEIYTSEGEQETSEGPALDLGPEEEGEPILPDGEPIIETEEPIIAMAPMGAAVAMEAPPDTMSNVMGILLILPCVAILYSVIVVLCGQKELTPSLLGPLENMGSPYGIHIIWYVMAGLAVVFGLVTGATAMAGGGGGAAKPKKEKKAKAPKAKKAKKEKKPKAPKKKKEKKPKKPKKKK
jgi:excisionase family DNA binding protein